MVRPIPVDRVEGLRALTLAVEFSRMELTPPPRLNSRQRPMLPALDDGRSILHIVTPHTVVDPRSVCIAP
jgi:hypothetical protein